MLKYKYFFKNKTIVIILLASFIFTCYSCKQDTPSNAAVANTSANKNEGKSAKTEKIVNSGETNYRKYSQLKGLRQAKNKKTFAKIYRINRIKDMSKFKNTMPVDLVVAGATIDRGGRSKASKVYLEVNSTLINTTYNQPNKDVAKHFNNNAFLDCGFKTTVNKNILKKGINKINIITQTKNGYFYVTPAQDLIF